MQGRGERGSAREKSAGEFKGGGGGGIRGRGEGRGVQGRARERGDREDGRLPTQITGLRAMFCRNFILPEGIRRLC